MVSFEDMAPWAIVAIVSRIARHVQGAVADRKDESERSAVNDAIQVAEESAQKAKASDRAKETSSRAQDVSDASLRDNQPKAAHAAFLAAEAAAAVTVVESKHELIALAQQALTYAEKVVPPESLQHFSRDIEQASELGARLTHDAPAPPEMLNVVKRQAVHEAGHAVAAARLGVCFTEVRIIYGAGVEFAFSPIDDPDDFSIDQTSDFRLVHAAGAAAEELFFDEHQAWGCSHDRSCHEKCDGTDFASDVAIVRAKPWFNVEIIGDLAEELRRCHRLSDIDVEEFFRRYGIELYD